MPIPQMLIVASTEIYWNILENSIGELLDGRREGVWHFKGENEKIFKGF